jgi:hypothetical protein
MKRCKKSNTTHKMKMKLRTAKLIEYTNVGQSWIKEPAEKGGSSGYNSSQAVKMTRCKKSNTTHVLMIRKKAIRKSYICKAERFLCLAWKPGGKLHPKGSIEAISF